MKKQVVIFDFDETMVLENSLGYLFKSIGGRFYWLTAIPAVLASIASLKFGYKLRRAVKDKLYAKHLTEMSIESVTKIGRNVAGQLSQNMSVIHKLYEAKQAGHYIVVATASPQLYVAAIVREMGLPVDVIIGTSIHFELGCINGDECSRESKWKAVSRLLSCDDNVITTAYGNNPDDNYMLSCVDHGFVVKGSAITPY
jgi:HAD superfamily phosphoserine phosphatase-like hydrolase